MKIGILEENLTDRQHIENALTNYFLSRKMSSSELFLYFFDNGIALMEEADDMDILILDIFLKESISGMESAKRIREMGIDIPIVFLTSSRDHALESYEVNASAYLLKPVNEKKLTAAFDRILAVYTPRELRVVSNRAKVAVSYKDIIYIESSGRTVSIFKKDGTTVRAIIKLDEIEKRIYDSRFLRSHKSFLVNMDEIKCQDGNFFILRNGIQIPIRQRESSAIRKRFVDYVLSQRSE